MQDEPIIEVKVQTDTDPNPQQDLDREYQHKSDPETTIVTNRPHEHVNNSLSDIYPFINDLVDTFYTEKLNLLVQQSIEQEQDKSVFMMFVMMYFGIHLKLKSENDQDKKDQIKLLLNDLIKNPEKRKYCIEMFETRFNHLFLQQPSSENKKILSIKHKRK